MLQMTNAYLEQTVGSFLGFIFKKTIIPQELWEQQETE